MLLHTPTANITLNEILEHRHRELLCKYLPKPGVGSVGYLADYEVVPQPV